MFDQSKKQERVQTKAHKTKYSALEIIRLNYIQGPKQATEWCKSYFLCNSQAYLKNYILSVYMN